MTGTMKRGESAEKGRNTEVFVFIPWFHPAYKAGGPIQSVANLVFLDKHRIYRVFCSDHDLDKSVLNVAPDCWISLNEGSKVWYSSKSVTRNMLRETKNGTVFINGIYSWNYNLKPILFSGAARKIVSVRGMLHPGALSQKRAKKMAYLAVWKFLGLHKKVEFHATTVEEKRHVHSVFGESIKVHVASNLPKRLAKQANESKRGGELRLVSIALISPMKNIQTVLEALQTVTADIRYDIYGPVKDKAYWEGCLRTINFLPANVEAFYHGDLLPMAVEGALEKAHVFILPSKSENFGHAIYEALSAGKPVITSHNTPWKGLCEAKAGRNVSLRSTEEMTAAINDFAAMEYSEFQIWSDGARSYADSAIDLESIQTQYANMFNETEPVTQTQCA